MWSTRDVGGNVFVVNTSPADERQVQAELTRLDPDLFLDKEIDPYGPYGPMVFYVVKQQIGLGHEPVAVLEWRDGHTPKPLTLDIVDHVRRREGRIRDAYLDAVVANDRKRQKAAEDVGEQAYEIALDARKVHGTHGAVLPRSQGLRRARDRARSKGEKR